jgi:hypothetical protein
VRAAAAYGGPGADLERWARGLRALAGQLLRGQLDAPGWQQAVAALCRTVAAADVLDAFDLRRLAARCRSFGPGEHRIAVHLPGQASDGAPAGELMLLTAGRSIPPHGRNSLATAHLVLCGSGRVRLYDRIEDQPGAVLLRPVADHWIEAGICFTGSEEGGNVHWLSAGSAPLVTLDLIVAVPGRAGFRHPCSRDGRLYLDPAGPIAADGLIRASLLDPRAALRRFGEVR